MAYAREWRTSGALLGLAALFTRELAAPYCLMAAAMALWHRRLGEVKVWRLGAALLLLYYALHLWQVGLQTQPGDLARHTSYWAVGGVSFVLETWRANGLLAVGPVWVFSLVVAAIVLAWWSPAVPVHLRAGVVVYALTFLVVGQSFNQYWGFMTAPMMSLWLAHAPGGLMVAIGYRRDAP